MATTDPALLPRLQALAARVQAYRERLSSISVTETVTQHRLNTKMKPTGKPRVFVYDVTIMRVPGTDGEDIVRAERVLKLIDGKPPKRRDEPECTDPESTYDDPLAFLLPESQAKLAFRVAAAKGDGATLEFEQPEPEHLEVTPKKIAECFGIDGGREVGRIWLDKGTDDPLRIESSLAEPFPIFYDRLKDASGNYMVVQHERTVITLAKVPFTDPEETLLLPESKVSEYEIHGAGTPRLRTMQVFTNYKRFMTEYKIKGQE